MKKQMRQSKLAFKPPPNNSQAPKFVPASKLLKQTSLPSPTQRINQKHHNQTNEPRHESQPTQPLKFDEPKFPPWMSQKPEQKRMIDTIRKSISQRTNCLVQSATGSGKTICLLTACLSALKTIGSSINHIIYLTRTHDQMSCIIKQLKDAKQAYPTMNFSVSMSATGLCGNQQIRELGQGQSLEQFQFICDESKKPTQKRLDWVSACEYLQIPKQPQQPDQQSYRDYQQYRKAVEDWQKRTDAYNKKYRQLKQKCLTEWKNMSRHSLESIIKSSTSLNVCPVSFQKLIYKPSEVKVMSYKYMTNKFIFHAKQLSQILRNSVIIFDQAHNILDTAKDEESFELRQDWFAKVLTQIRLYQQYAQQRLFDEDLQGEQQRAIIENCQALDKFAQYVKEAQILSQTIRQIAFKKPYSEKVLIQIEEITECFSFQKNILPFGLLNRVSRVAKIIKRAIALKKKKNKEIPKVSMSAFSNFLFSYLQLANTYVKGQITHVCVVDRKDKTKLGISFECVTSKLMFSRLAKAGAKNMIFASGTLDQAIFEEQTGLKFHKYIQPESDQTNKNVQTFMMQRSPISGNKFVVSMEQPQYDQVIDVLLKTIPLIPYGVMVFFKSYSYMQQIRRLIESRRLWNNNKPLYYETSQKKQFSDEMKNYIRQSQKFRGAVMMGVCRGKISEGYDFKDNLCRALFLVGLPLQEYKGVKYRIQELVLKNQGKLNSWYYKDAMKAANQALGRLVRHTQDFGQVYILSEKVRCQFKHLSAWVKKTQLYQNLDLQAMQKKTKLFFQNREQQMRSLEAQVIDQNQVKQKLQDEDDLSEEEKQLSARGSMQSRYNRASGTSKSSKFYVSDKDIDQLVQNQAPSGGPVETGQQWMYDPACQFSGVDQYQEADNQEYSQKAHDTNEEVTQKLTNYTVQKVKAPQVGSQAEQSNYDSSDPKAQLQRFQRLRTSIKQEQPTQRPAFIKQQQRQSEDERSRRRLLDPYNSYHARARERQQEPRIKLQRTIKREE